MALALFYEDGRVSFLRRLTGEERRHGFRFVIANLDISYLAEALGGPTLVLASLRNALEVKFVRHA